MALKEDSITFQCSRTRLIRHCLIRQFVQFVTSFYIPYKWFVRLIRHLQFRF